MSGIPVVILAGGRMPAELQAETGISNRALLPIRGKPMLEWTAEALREASTTGSVIVVGDVPEMPGALRVPDQGGLVENVYAGIAAAGSVEHLLISTSDIPFLTPESVDDFIARALELQADLVYPIVEVAECRRRFPGVGRTSVRLREGEFTGGNILLVRPPFMERQRGRLAAAYAARKQPLRLAAMLGPGTTVRLLGSAALKRPFLDIPRLERAASRLLGGVARALITPYAEIATDIDTPEQARAYSS